VKWRKALGHPTREEILGGAAALADLRSLHLHRHAHEPPLDRVWARRQNLSAYDAVYVALAEALDTVVLTCDGHLARAAGAARHVEFIAAP
jgi:predicted nucleic acid-binding protein